jgi:hypothetical protein
MASDDRPRGRDAVICAALIARATNGQAARQADVSERTAARVREKHREYVMAERDANAERAAALLLAAVPRAAHRMVTLVDSDREELALAASRFILDGALKWRDQTEVERRVAALEQQSPPTGWSNLWAERLGVDLDPTERPATPTEVRDWAVEHGVYVEGVYDPNA